MFPLGFVIGAVAGATAVLVLGPEIAVRARPVAKTALKAALMAMHEAQVRSAEIAEAAEDLYAEAKSEVTAEVFASAMAAAPAKAAARAAGSSTPAGAGANAQTRPAVKVARRRTAVKRSRAPSSRHG
jgi:hypothetical protein